MDESDKIAGYFVSPFLEEVNACVSRNLSTARGEIENALHQRLQSYGDKNKQVKQLNIASHCAEHYMKQVESIFDKNFNKFERYIRRNIVHIPEELEEFVVALLKENVESHRSVPHSVVVSDDISEKDMELDIAKLRQELLRQETMSQRLDREKRDMDEAICEFSVYEKELAALKDLYENDNARKFHDQMEHLRECIGTMNTLYDSVLQKQSQDEDRAVKRARFEELRTRFLSHSNGRTLSDLAHANESLTNSNTITDR